MAEVANFVNDLVICQHRVIKLSYMAAVVTTAAWCGDQYRLSALVVIFFRCPHNDPLVCSFVYLFVGHVAMLTFIAWVCQHHPIGFQPISSHSSTLGSWN
jgi:hypothetical protein